MYKADLVASNVIIFSDIMVGGDEVQEVQDETQGQQLTDEDVKEINEKVDEKEEADVLAVLLKKIIDTILIEEFFEANRKMNLFRYVLSQGVLKFAEKHAGDTAKLDRLVDSFRAAWKVYKEDGDEKTTMDVFMKNFGTRMTWRRDCTRDPVVLLFLI